jgi:hypothetical protein
MAHRVLNEKIQREIIKTQQDIRRIAFARKLDYSVPVSSGTTVA